MNKKDIRKKFLKIRNSFGEDKLKYISDKIVDDILSLNEYKESKNILLYNSFGSEIRLKSLEVSAIKMNKNVYYPVVMGDDMFFIQINKYTVYKKGAFGIEEPLGEIKKFFDNGLIVVPMLAYNKTLNRLGYGKGYYDKFLEKNTKLYKLGVCFQDFEIDLDFQDGHDIVMNKIISY